jgi:DNA polymerase-3 subunit epsilon
MTGTSWKDAPLVALDLEGTGAQDRDDEAILEIATVPLADGRPSLDDAYTTLINPQRPVPKRRWISPGLTNEVLTEAPTLDIVAPQLATRLDGRIIVGHNVGVDWRLLHRRCPSIRPTGLIDTLRLARHVHAGEKHRGLTALLERHKLTEQVTALAPGSRPHRALWDTTGAALLLETLIETARDGDTFTLNALRRLAGIPLGDSTPAEADAEQLPLLDL